MGAVAAVTIIVWFVRHENKRHPIKPKHATPEIATEEFRSVSFPTPPVSPTAIGRRAVSMMKIYLVTVTDPRTASIIDNAADDDQLVISCDGTEGPVDSVKEYVNVSD
jgi:hypothetical protein